MVGDVDLGKDKGSESRLGSALKKHRNDAFFQTFLPDKKRKLCFCYTVLPIFATPNGNGSVAQLNRASDYGSEGFRFES